jgi:hypothetical protein
MDEGGWESVRPYMEANKMTYRVVVDDGSIAGLYGGIDSLPTTLIIDRSGRIASTHVGLVSKGDYRKEIEKLLK